jgi:hypothetical protein
MVDVTTPDGRTLTLPRSIVPASALPQIAQTGAPSGALPLNVPAQQPVQEAPAPALPPPPDTAPTVDPNVVETDASVVEMGEPETRRVTQKQLAKEQLAQKAAQAKAAKEQARYNASDEGKYANAQTGQQDAVEGEKTAVAGAADVEAAEQEVIGRAMVERNQQLDGYYAKRAEDAQANVEAEEAKTNEIIGLRKKIAGTKIDRSADHPVMLAIFAGIAGLGSAMKGEKVNTLELIYQAIDRKVAAQEADLDRMGKIYGMTKDELEMLKEKSKSRLEFHNTLIAAETDKAKRHLEEIVALSASEKTRAHAKILMAQLDTRAQEKTMDAVRWGMDFNQKDKHHKEAQKTQRYGIAVQDRHNKATEQLQREKMWFDYQQSLADKRAKGDEAAYKAQLEAETDASKRGVRDMTGEYIFTPQGRAKMEEAAKLEATAKALEDAAKADPTGASAAGSQGAAAVMKQKAAALRGDARAFDAIKAHNETEAINASKVIASGQSTVQLIDEIKQIYDDVGRGLIKRDEAQSALRSKFNLLKPNLKEAWQLGAWDKGSAGLVDLIIGSDPTSDWNTGMLGMVMQAKMWEDPEAFKKGLDAVAKDLEVKAQNTLVGMGAKFDKGATVLLRAAKREETPVDKASAKLTQGQSALEVEKNADQVGVVGKVARKVGYPFSPSHAEEAEAAGSARYPGLTREQEAPFETLVKAYRGGNEKAGDQLIAKVANEAAKRPDFAIALLHNLRDQDPKLYVAARAALPKDSQVDKQMSYEEQSRVGAGIAPTNVLAPMVARSIKPDGTVGDTEGYKELARRAGRGDPDAKKAIVQLVEQAGRTRSSTRSQADQAAQDEAQVKMMKKIGAGGATLKGTR